MNIPRNKILKSMAALVAVAGLTLAVAAPAWAQDSLVDAAKAGVRAPILPPQAAPLSEPGPLTVYASRDDFDLVVPVEIQSCEDFEDTNIADGSVEGFDGPLDASTDTALFPAGSIVAGLTIDVPTRDFDDLVAVGAGFFGSPSDVVLADFFVDPLDLAFSETTNAVALDVVNLLSPGPVTVSFFDTSDVLIGSVGVAASGSTTGFVGVFSPVPIGRVVIDSDNDGAEGGDDICFANVIPDTALFNVTKTFSDGNDAEVEVMLTCNSGLPLEQSFTIAGGDPDGVTFVVTDIPDTGADCAVTESGSPGGYTVELNGGAGCEWEDVTVGYFTCEITNAADPATYTVLKDFTVQRDGGDVVIPEADITIECDSAIVGGDEDDGTWTLSGKLTDGQTLVATVDTTEGPATCSATEEITQSGVEQSSSGCGPTALPAGGSHTCTFTNTVFFEGIPTLSQYGLAILVLLTLGVGFIGFRRFV